MNLCHLIFFIFCFAYKIESTKIKPNFDEIFGDGWNKNENVSLEKREENGSESIEQIQNDQNIIKNDQNTKEEQNNQQKKETIHKFEAIKEKLKQRGKYQGKNRIKIETKIGRILGTNRKKIYKWKKEMNLNKRKRMQNSFYEQKKKEFIERFDEFKSLYGQGKQKEFVKELGISNDTFLKWKKELLPKHTKIKNKNSNDDKLHKVKQYFKIKARNPKINDKLIAKKLGIGSSTMRTWKKKFASASEM